ncbi:helix-turn-helix domain-containing protein [Haloarcula sp. JP-L23]|uniref:helix-turn-helix domain-containing protein n=1 Tax=Haloarcula sp. JP-L23 TaxID=2716717 RepID=UPI002107921A
MTTIPTIVDQISNQLTTKQEAALSTAYTRGYYAWPRESTAEDLAETMDIASSTLHYHLRHALHQLLTVFFEQECL